MTRTLPALLLAVSLAACSTQPTTPPNPTRPLLNQPTLVSDAPEGVPHVVRAVPDPLTVELADGTRVRIALLAPPADCWAPQALAFARTTLLARTVRVSSITPGEASLLLEDGTDYALLAVREGVLRSQGADGGRFTDAEMAAAQANRGLWGPPCEGMDPSEPTKAVAPTPVTTTPPPPARTTAPPPPPPPAPPRPCAVGYVITAQWQGGFTAEVTLRNTSASPVNGWTVGWTFGGDQAVTQMWRARLLRGTSPVRAFSEDYTAEIAPGGTVSFGFNGSVRGANPEPAAFTLNGSACAVE
ncbi:cellulose binding domain-containing protein [Nocardia sp. NRRL S-836]|uniref:cellulose binding domain-containing protein n=1 Tax=Nocardia sp. NRRL S-836 TaxID=1519492 RepID=UPI0006AE42BC|nr:cellulose binding domain-containing protein [Nocardia sp. NRRL S-836]